MVIIRHGEKPGKGDNLNCMGLNRALALPAVLDTVTGRPDYTYVPTISTGKKTSSVRMFQTVTPFAIKDSLTINSHYEETATDSVAKDVLKKRGMVLMVWEHSNIPPLAKALVGKKHAGIIGGWNKLDFDSIWTIDFKLSKKGNLTFCRYATGQENIFPSPDCR
ncbi:hypothetical protein GCM10027043_00570 [Ferruginibacter profundus]